MKTTSNLTNELKPLTSGVESLKGYSKPKRKWSERLGSVDRFWQDYFTKYPDYGSMDELNELRERYNDTHEQ